MLTRELRLDGWPALSIHGDKKQEERTWVLSEFKNGRNPIMVATDVASRGLDVKDIRHVVNYDMPGQIEDYVHRIGRTGRAGSKGKASLFLQFYCVGSHDGGREDSRGGGRELIECQASPSLCYYSS